MSERMDIHAVSNHRDAEKLNDLQYVMYCHNEARKLFEALMDKRWPGIAPERRRRAA